MKIPRLLCLGFLCFAFAASAQEEAVQEEAVEEFEAVPEPPDLPDPLQSGQPIEPEVTIKQTTEGVIEEYRVSGRLYMVKITPQVGPAYYLVDRDGDGKMETRLGRIDEDNAVPQWVIFSW